MAWRHTRLISDNAAVTCGAGDGIEWGQRAATLTGGAFGIRDRGNHRPAPRVAPTAINIARDPTHPLLPARRTRVRRCRGLVCPITSLANFVTDF